MIYTDIEDISIFFFMHAWSSIDIMIMVTSGGGAVAQKLYTPARTAPRNPYPQWHKFSKTLPLVAQNSGCNPYPYYWHRSTKKLPKSGLFVQLLVRSAENPANLVQFFTFFTLSGTKNGKIIPSLAHIWCSKLAHCLKTLPSVALTLAKMVPYPS